MKHKILTFFLACLVPWLAGAQQSANSQNNVAEKDYIAYLFTYFTGNHISEDSDADDVKDALKDAGIKEVTTAENFS